MRQGVTVLHKLYGRRVTRHPGNIAKKSGKRICLQEADALRVAEQAGLPVPHVHQVETTPDGKHHISMDYIEGQVLTKAWPEYSEVQKRTVVQQLREILTIMRSIPPPEGYIGDCTGNQIRDTRLYFTHNAPACQDERGFNQFLIDALVPEIPIPVHQAFIERWNRDDHRVVFTHSDVAPRNIIVRDGNIVGLLDWEDAGWYPEYWEYVKFFQRSSIADGDWRNYADDIFPQPYHTELVDYLALSRWQYS